MIPDDIQALALADAIGALDLDERRDLVARLATLPASVRADVAQLYDASVEIAAGASGEEPSRGVRHILLARVAAPSNHTITSTEGEWVETAVPGVRIRSSRSTARGIGSRCCSRASRAPGTRPIVIPGRRSAT